MTKKRKIGRPLGSTKKIGASPKSWHPSEAKSEVAKSRVKDERGYFLGKRQIRFDINYKPLEQEYNVTAISGNGLVDQEERASGMEVIQKHMERIFKNWRANLE